jgi:YidC/Oxa1 family membrane protein insertase
MNVLTIVQQFLMKRFLIDEDKIHAKIQLKQSQPRKKSKFQRKLDEIMEQQEAAKKNKK